MNEDIKQIVKMLLLLSMVIGLTASDATVYTEVPVVHRAKVNAIEFNPVVDILASGGDDNLTVLWNTSSSEIINYVELAGPVSYLRWNKAGSKLAAIAENLTILDQKLDILSSYPVSGDTITSINWVGEEVVIGMESGEIILDGEGLYAGNATISDIEVYGAIIVAATESSIVVIEDGKIDRYSLDLPVKAIEVYNGTVVFPQGSSVEMLRLADGALMEGIETDLDIQFMSLDEHSNSLAVYGDGAIQIWDLTEKSLLGTKSDRGEISNLDFSNNIIATTDPAWPTITLLYVNNDFAFSHLASVSYITPEENLLPISLPFTILGIVLIGVMVRRKQPQK